MKSILLTLFLVSNAGAVSVHAPSPNGTDITPATVTSAGCIKTDADGVEFNANCTAGRVGIGDATPDETLQVVGTVKSTNIKVMDGFVNGVAGEATSFEGAYPYVRIMPTGGKGIGWSAGFAEPNDWHMWRATSAGGDPRSQAYKILWMRTDGALNINPDGGNVGIGMAGGSPSSKLHMSSGTLTLDGNVSPSLTVTNAIRPAVKTKAEIHAITPALGDVYVCSDCTNTYTLCSGTGTAINDFREVGTATGCNP